MSSTIPQDTTASSLSACLDMLESKLTSKEFDENVQRSKFLADCKRGNFNRLKALGLIGKQPRSKAAKVKADKQKELAIKFAALVNELDYTYADASRECGRETAHLKTYCERFNIKVRTFQQQREHLDKKTLKGTIQQVNKNGLSLTACCDLFKVSLPTLRAVIERGGYVFDKTSLTINPAK